MKVPIKELKDLVDRMRDLAKVNEKDMQEYLLKDQYNLYVQAKAHKNNSEFWAYRVEDIINRYEEGGDEDE